MDEDNRSDAAVSVETETDFAWTRCAHLDIGERVLLKQQAVDDGFAYARQLREELQACIDGLGADQEAAFNLMGGNEIRAWMEEQKELEQENHKLEILIGVAGAMGAGKTSLLNALLEYPELLPASSTEAATATVCRIAWNHSDAPDHRFGAEIIFRSKESVIQELNSVLSAVKDRKELRTQEFEDEGERCEAIEEVTGIISRGITKACAAWDLDENEIEDMDYTVESVLANKGHIESLLGEKLIIHSADVDEFAAEIKPYLDSTSTPQGITTWPLIEEVRVYVKSDALKHGIVLVDLPGLSDMVEDRSAVAERYYQNLCVTIIVAPAIRAVDEKTGVKLMGNYQELRMQLDGKYNKDSFCVVVSKIDDIDDCDGFCKANKEARQDAQLQADATEFKVASKSANEKHKELRVVERKLESLTAKCAVLRARIDESKGKDTKRAKTARLRAKRTRLMRDRQKQMTLRKNLFNEAAELDRNLATLESRRKHRCIWIRNQYIKSRICHDFARQKKLARLSEHDKERYDGSVEVFPVCAAAFKTLLKRRKSIEGFPSPLYTGVPRLRQWLGESVFAYRETHLDSMLRGLQRLHDGMKCWSDDDSRGMVDFSSRKEIEFLLNFSHNKFQKKLETAFARGVDEVKQLTPVRNKEDIISSSKSMAAQAASRWAYKFPDEANATKKMTWVTYQAILKNDGGPFQSNGVGRPFYDFPLALGTPFLEALRDDWSNFFQVQLPKATVTLKTLVDGIWDEYMAEVRAYVRDTAPSVLPYFDSIADPLERIEDNLYNGIAAAVKALSTGASQIHPLFTEVLRADLRPLFCAALDIKGPGHFARRQTFLRDSVSTSAGRLAGRGLNRLKQAHANRVGTELPRELKRIARVSISQVITQLGLLLDNLQAHRKVALQETAKGIALVWAAQWRASREESEDVVLVDERMAVASVSGCYDIPEEYVEDKREDDGESEKREGGEEATDVESELSSDTDDEDIKKEE